MRLAKFAIRANTSVEFLTWQANRYMSPIFLSSVKRCLFSARKLAIRLESMSETKMRGRTITFPPALERYCLETYPSACAFSAFTSAMNPSWLTLTHFTPLVPNVRVLACNVEMSMPFVSR